jgi:PAS domain S-box-containing protein
MIQVLYVDDEDELLDLGKSYLERSGEIRVDTVDSVKIARERLLLTKYDAIVSDYQMPSSNGIEFLKELRGAGNPIPFILFTGKGREEVVIEALNSGADFYLQKGGKPRAQFTELEHKIRESVRRNQAERALKENEERLRAAQAIGKTGCWEFRLDSSGGHIWGSEEAFRIFGLPRNEQGLLDLEKVEERITEREKVHQALVDLLVAGKRYELEYEIIPASGGEKRIISSVAERIDDREGRVTKVVGIIQDITEAKGLEKELLQKTALFEAQAMATLDGILVIDEAFRRILINQRVIDLFNPPQHALDNPEDDNLLLNHVMGLTSHPDEFIQKVNYLNNHHQETSRDEIQLKDGRVLDRFSAPVIGKDGHYYGRTWIFRDITEQKQAEMSLKENEEKYQAIFNNELYAICIFDLADYRLVDVNEAFCRLHGYDREELLRNVTMKELAAEMDKSLESVAQATEKGTVRVPLRYMKRKDGTTFPVEIVGGPYRRGGRMVMFAIIHDISDRLNIDGELRAIGAM